MAAPTNTVTSATPNVGVREDLEDVIYRVAPEETPFLSAIGSSGKATNVSHEWQTETLAAPNADNAQLEGDDVGALDAPNLTTRLGNYCQILRKTGGVSRTQEIVNKAGRNSELARQKTLKGIELRRDAEKRFIGNNAAQNESGSDPRKAAGILAFLTSNVSRGSGGANGTLSGTTSGFPNAAATNGATRTFTEALVKGVLATAFGNGGKPTQAYMGPAHKQQFSEFTGIADIRQEVKGKEMGVITAAADVYVSDFGPLALIPHPYGLSRDCIFVDPNYAGVATLDGVKSKPLAASGDNEKFLLTMEKTLVVKNEKAHGVVADLA
jgi:hypothetical protein